MGKIKVDRLRRTAAEIEREHEAVKSAMTDALAHAREAGRLLTEAKTQVKHGAWRRWIAANCAFSERTAQTYMRIHGRWGEIEKRNAVADLGIGSAIRLLTEPKRNFPDPGRNGFFGVKGAVTVIVWPDLRDGFFYVTRWDDRPDGSTVAEGTARPVLGHWVGEILELMRLPPGIEWRDFRFAPEPCECNWFMGGYVGEHDQDHDGWPIMARGRPVSETI